jgi:hypothetical protein
VFALGKHVELHGHSRLVQRLREHEAVLDGNTGVLGGVEEERGRRARGDALLVGEVLEQRGSGEGPSRFSIEFLCENGAVIDITG